MLGVFSYNGASSGSSDLQGPCSKGLRSCDCSSSPEIPSEGLTLRFSRQALPSSQKTLFIRAAQSEPIFFQADPDPTVGHKLQDRKDYGKEALQP